MGKTAIALSRLGVDNLTAEHVEDVLVYLTGAHVDVHGTGQFLIDKKIDPKLIIQMARAAWWMSPAISDQYRRILDTRIEPRSSKQLTQPSTTVLIGKAWDESVHPRHPAGSEDGGQFAPRDQGIDVGTGKIVDVRESQWAIFKEFGKVTNAGTLKDSVIRALAAGSGEKYDAVNRFIAQWAESSNDHDLRSLGIQEAATDAFEVELSDWQAKTLETLLDERSDGVADGDETYLYPFETLREARREDDPDPFKERASNMLGVMYKQTQDWFKKMGVTHVKLYRGTSPKEVSTKSFKTGDVVTYTDNALSSWAITQEVTKDFDEGVVLSAIFPVDRILCSCLTGFGSFKEYEFVVIGSNDSSYAHVEKKSV